MRALHLTIVLILLSRLVTFGQIQVASVTVNDTVSLRGIPRLAFDIGIPVNIMGPYAVIRDEKTYMESGLFVTNKGFIYEQDGARFVHRLFGINIPIRGGVIIDDKYYVGAGHNFNIPFHYKAKRFDAGGFKNKEILTSEFFSKRTARFYPSIEISAGVSIHGVGRFSVRLQTFYLDFFNPAFEEDGVLPFEALVVENKLNLVVISYNPGL